MRAPKPEAILKMTNAMEGFCPPKPHRAIDNGRSCFPSSLPARREECALRPHGAGHARPRERPARDHSGTTAAAAGPRRAVRRESHSSSIDPISESPTVGGFSPRARADGPRVMPENARASKI
jgi:hypothetical protein